MAEFCIAFLPIFFSVVLERRICNIRQNVNSASINTNVLTINNNNNTNNKLFYNLKFSKKIVYSQVKGGPNVAP